MLSILLAQQLKAAGLRWQPTEHDRFAIPGREMDNKVFILSEFTALLQELNGQPAITFHGTVEWALDYVLQTEALWLPSETQLREALEARLDATDAPELALIRRDAGYECVIGQGRSSQSFTAEHAPQAYAQALLHLLNKA